MKKTITGVVSLLAGAFVAHSQGTVSFANYLALSTYIYVSLGSTKLGGSSTTTTGNPTTDAGNGSDWTVALYGAMGSGVAASGLSQLNDASSVPVTAHLESWNAQDGAAGTWYLSFRVQPVPVHWQPFRCMLGTTTMACTRLMPQRKPPVFRPVFRALAM
jgi:hypothetical protein